MQEIKKKKDLTYSKAGQLGIIIIDILQYILAGFFSPLCISQKIGSFVHPVLLLAKST